jgi:CRISPR-associated exonuclease Cas4
MDTCINSCKKTNWIPATQFDVRVISEKHNIVGMVDRITDDGTFSIIRAAGAMPFGTYSSDRLRIACIAFCLEEMTGEEVIGGNVEYIPDGVSRFHTVQPRDRRQVIATLNKIRSINKGDVPTHPLNAPCKRCKFRERCESNSGRRLSDILWASLSLNKKGYIIPPFYQPWNKSHDERKLTRHILNSPGFGLGFYDLSDIVLPDLS